MRLKQLYEISVEMKVLEHWGLPPELVEKVMSVHAEQRLRGVHRKKMHQTLDFIKDGDLSLKRRLGSLYFYYLNQRRNWHWLVWNRYTECWIQI